MQEMSKSRKEGTTDGDKLNRRERWRCLLLRPKCRRHSAEVWEKNKIRKNQEGEREETERGQGGDKEETRKL